MNHPWRLFLSLCWLLALLLLPACTPNGPSTPTPPGIQLTVAQVKGDYMAYEGLLAGMQGYGVIMMTAPLCPGYVGMDTRIFFVDAQQENIVAVLTATAEGAQRSDTLREFQAHVRVFNGQIGCPGSLGNVTFPYLEIVGIKE